jgi:organic hydroperoxide reductase OsmC/OhrA
VLILRRVRVEYHLRVPRETREVAERVHEVHQASCPVARSITPGVVIETTLNFA